jgi:hypothetical protein
MGRWRSGNSTTTAATTKVVPRGELFLTGGDVPGAVVGTHRGVRLAASAAKQRVVEGDHHGRTDRHQPPNYQPEQREPELIETPPGGGEEAMRPAVMPHPSHPRGGEHPAHGPPRRCGDQSRDQGDERVERTRGEARPEPIEQLCG